MASPAAVQTLLAAFSFGILLEAASGTLLIHFKGYGWPKSQDGRRLVLMLFLFFSALWALTDFINMTISSSPTACQAALVFSTLSDQLARVGIEQFLLWSVGHGAKLTAERLILQAILGFRFIIGLILVGFTRPDFAPVCVAGTSVLPIAIAVIALDVIIIGMLAIRAYLIGLFKGMQPSTQQEQGKALVLILVGFTLWTGTSVAMILGIRNMTLIVRSTLPSIGLLILVGIVGISTGSLLSSREEGMVTPEARSPFMARSPPSEAGGISPETVEGSSPMSGINYATNGNLFSVNTSITTRALPNMTSQVKYQESRKGFIKLGIDGMMKATRAKKQDHSKPTTGVGNQIPRGISPPTFTGSSLSANQGASVPQTKLTGNKARDLPLPPSASHITQQKLSLFKWPKSVTPPTVRTMGISKPVIANNDSSSQPFTKIKTIDLAAAAANERERREDAATRARLIPNRPAPPPPSHLAHEALRRTISVKRKEMPISISVSMPPITNSTISGLSVGFANGSTTSTSLSPGREDMRRRSPRKIDGFERIVDEKDPRHGPLERTSTIGLPSNARSDRLVAVEKEQTVMFIRDIAYDNPGIVNSIINQGADMYTSENKIRPAETSRESSYAIEPKSSRSIIHRPRPYRRDTEKDRALFPSEAYPHHRRSKSGSSIIATRKSIFASHPGSPTQLPNLPDPPTSASKLAHILSNNNKSMTFHEKIQFLFPAPPKSSLANNRSSSVPSLSRLPSFYISESDGDEQSSRASKRSIITPFGSEDVWIAEAPPIVVDTRNGQESPIHGSRTNSNGAFIPSEATSSSRSDFTMLIDQSHATSSVRSTAMSHGIVHRPEEPEISTFSASDGNRQSFFLDANQALPGDKTPSPRSGSAWHRRIGDELPTFSVRRKNSNRKMPPPTPLLLDSKGRNMNVIIHSPAPSPIDSPTRAIKEIQIQLNRFEQRDRGSVGSLLRYLPDTNSTALGNISDDPGMRSRLLQNLEDEMGHQESLWQHMQVNIDHDSNSINLTPLQLAPSVKRVSRGPSHQSELQRASVRNSMTRSEVSRSSSSSQSSSNSRASVWQQRLAEAQMEYLENAPALNRNPNLNFLSLSRSPIGSPTPPDSIESETDIEISSESELELSNSAGAYGKAQDSKPSLWQPQPILPKASFKGVWDLPYSPCTRHSSPEAPAKTIRPPKRLIQEEMPIFSFTLWSKPCSSANGCSIGLWNSRKVRPSSINIRRAAQRPQRKSKRVTCLPDIVESPVPLPHKTGTLGIFQFPSGEISDSAVYQSALVPALLANSVVNNTGEVTTKKSYPEPMEYSSSFFDEYDEQDNSEDLESDDDFDENTLWEISSLLSSRDFPSQENLSPLARGSEEAFHVCDDETRFERDFEGEDTISAESVDLREIIQGPSFQLPILPLALKSKDGPKLWTSRSIPTPSAHCISLPQPDSRFWESYILDSPSGARLKRHTSANLPALTTSGLWACPPLEKPTPPIKTLWRLTETSEEASSIQLKMPVRESTMLWDPCSKRLESQMSITSSANLECSYREWSNFSTERILTPITTRATRRHNHGSSLVGFPKLWSAPAQLEAKPVAALCAESAIKSAITSVHHTNNSLPNLVSTVRKARENQTPDQLTSAQLWNGRQSPEEEHHWMTESTLRPESPSIRSEISSGASSPTSDVSSFKSNSTNTSSLSGSLKLVELPTDDISSANFPVRQPASRPLRGSRVLSFLDLFESRAPRLADISAKKQRRSTVCAQSSTTLQKPLRHQNTTSPGLGRNWNDALPKTIDTGRPNTIPALRAASKPDTHHPFAEGMSQCKAHFQRPHCTPEMWKAALGEAITLSTIQRVPSAKPCNVTICHPVFFSRSLVSSAIDIHPAAIGYVERPAVCSDRSYSIAIHEAIAPAICASEAHMWTPRTNTESTEDDSTGLWMSRSTDALPSPALFSNPHARPWDKKKRGSMSTKDITSAELWRLSNALPDSPKYWLMNRRISKVDFRY